ncbi:cytochrome P450 [Coniochaeta ligniaria NRRL 30616]|uniref:Cytochrome P450 n=1 Tax=Coniochaeta ligniaria NRRL 30616 TaxID=1408157 RepID=A0A1J7ISI9_9PEZI|nr:cytochrome P450 [Coniochaeta ligniaria NRRL 30616]
MISEILLQPVYLAAVAGVVLLGRVFTLPKGLPIIGLENEWFAMRRAAFRNNMNFKAVMQETYTKYSSKGRAVILPLLTGTVVVLPPSDTQFLVDAPESQVSMHEQVRETFQLDYTVVDQDLIHRPLHYPLLAITLTSQVGNLVPDVMDEVDFQVRQEWGTETSDWREVPVYGSMHKIISKVTNRVFVGLPTCREPALAENARRYAQCVPVSAYLLRCTPKWLKPLVGPLLTLRGRWHTYQFCKIVKPTIERRLKEFDARKGDPEANKTVRNDFLEWSIKQAEEIGDPSLRTPRKLGERILVLNFAAIHTTSLTITGAILDIVCHNKPEHIDELRREISAVLAEHGGEWNKRALGKMHRLDSTLRESTRLNSFVTAREGIDTPSGAHVGYKMTVSVPNYSVLHDKNVYGEDADQFKPFRFAEQRADESVGYVERARKAFPTTSKDFLAFGHGRNACPGRFFATNEIKLLFAYRVMNYDFKMETERPRSTFVGLVRVAPLKKTIWIRRREKS